jgi:hypothetical protein
VFSHLSISPQLNGCPSRLQKPYEDLHTLCPTGPDLSQAQTSPLLFGGLMSLDEGFLDNSNHVAVAAMHGQPPPRQATYSGLGSPAGVSPPPWTTAIDLSFEGAHLRTASQPDARDSGSRHQCRLIC